MKIIYLDINDGFKCYTTDNGSRLAVETSSFDGKCDAFIEGHRFVPKGQTWTREDGVVFEGEMVTAWRDTNELDRAQLEYEKQLFAEQIEALSIMGVVV